LSSKVLGWIWILICLASLARPVPLTLTTYCSPILVTPSEAFTSVLFESTVTVTFEVTWEPFTKTLILSAVKLLLLKYLSVPFTVIVAVWLAALALELTLSQIGSTTSTTVELPLVVPPFTLIPEVRVIASFLFPAVSVTLFAGIATVITPL